MERSQDCVLHIFSPALPLSFDLEAKHPCPTHWYHIFLTPALSFETTTTPAPPVGIRSVKAPLPHP